MTCPSCGAEVSLNAGRCGACGRVLNRSRHVAAATLTPPPIPSIDARTGQLDALTGGVTRAGTSVEDADDFGITRVVGYDIRPRASADETQFGNLSDADVTSFGDAPTAFPLGDLDTDSPTIVGPP